jgi:hypothetical protein
MPIGTCFAAIQNGDIVSDLISYKVLSRSGIAGLCAGSGNAERSGINGGDALSLCFNGAPYRASPHAAALLIDLRIARRADKGAGIRQKRRIHRIDHGNERVHRPALPKG